jgi:hypothetical protein
MKKLRIGFAALPLQRAAIGSLRMRGWVASFLLVTAGLLMIPQAYAVTTPTTCGNPNFTTPLQALVGTWSFSARGFARTDLMSLPFSAAGQFEATIGGTADAPTGLLTITMTTMTSNTNPRQQTLSGTYEVFPDCSGGTLTFNASSHPILSSGSTSGAAISQFNFDFLFVVDGKIAAVSTIPFLEITLDGFGGGFDGLFGTGNGLPPAPQTCTTAGGFCSALCVPPNVSIGQITPCTRVTGPCCVRR